MSFIETDRDLELRIKLLEALTESTDANLAYLDRNLDFVWVNSTYVQKSGHSRDELLGRNHFDLFPNAENEVIFKQVRDTGQAYEVKAKPFEYADQPDRGTTYWDWSLTPIKDDDGSVAGLVLSLVDVTSVVRSHQRVEELARQLADERRFLGLILDNMPVAVAYLDKDCVFRQANVVTALYIGKPLDEIIGHHLRDVVPQLPEAMERVRHALDTGKPLSERVVSYAPPGQDEGCYLVAYTPNVDESGVVQGVFATFQDITALMDAQTQAEEQAAQLQSTISSMTDGVSLIGADQRLQLINQAGRDILGAPYDLEISEWSDILKLSHFDGKPVTSEQHPVARALSGEYVRDVRYRAVNQWREMIVSLSISPVTDSQGRVTGATTVFRDVTERAELEQHKEMLYEREHRIADMLQQALLPAKTNYTLDGCAVAVRYQPALKEAEVGGDFYDVFELGDGRIGILIGDVAGKGLAAAIRVAAARHAIRSYAYLDGSPGVVMTLANEALCRDDAGVSGMLTALFAVVDMSEHTITFANGGHEPPVLMRDNKAEEVQVYGLALGAFEGYRYIEVSRRIKPGDRVIMVTDGIIEARSGGEFVFEKDRMIEYMLQVANQSPDEIAAGLLSAATIQADGCLQDDAAVVVFQVEDFQ